MKIGKRRRLLCELVANSGSINVSNIFAVGGHVEELTIRIPRMPKRVQLEHYP